MRKVVFVSNYLNHHQIPFSDAMYKELDGNYSYIQTEPMEDERKGMGWEIDEEKYPYLLKSYEDRKRCTQLIDECDAVIIGSAPDELIKKRTESGKLTFRYSERIYKNGQWRAVSPRGIYHMYQAHSHSRGKNMYMLCASAYTACDLNLFGYYRNRMLKWGYFPENFQYDVEALLEKKDRNDKVEMVWCGRFIKWKHPEYVIELARHMRQRSMLDHVHITMIGVGELRGKYEAAIREENLEGNIDITGPLSPSEVRKKMLEASMFLATSDYHEGWGVVINEAMNSACTVVASHAMGAVPFLIRHGENGLVYKSGNAEDFIKKAEWALAHPEQRRILSRNAYETIHSEWNAKNAASSFLTFVESVLDGKTPEFQERGPCSEAEIVPQWEMYHRLTCGESRNV